MDSKKVVWGGVAIVILAALDLLAAFLAKEFSIRPRWVVFAGGIVAFAVLFVVYIKSLAVTELWIVTFGWVVLLEIGVLLVDRIHFGTSIPPHKYIVAAMIVGLQVVLLLPLGRSAHGDEIVANEPMQRIDREITPP